MKSIVSHFMLAAFCLIMCSFKQTPDSVLLSQFDEESLEVVLSDSLVGYTGEVHFDECHATVKVPEGFIFLDKEDTRRLLIDYWDNAESAMDYTLGSLVPSTAELFYQIEIAYIIRYDNCGYVKDDDANSVDYDKMMKDIHEEEKEENPKLPEESRLYTKGWEFTPKYLSGSHALVWAKRLTKENGFEWVNYDMRILCKDGLVSLMAVLDTEDSQEVKVKEMDIINSLSFDEGYAYADFDASRDRVSEWTIGGLVAGSILAKSGLLAKIGILLLKGWKIIALAIAGIGGFFFKKKKK